MTINKETYISDIWKLFRDRINSSITSIDTVGFGTVNVKGVYSTYPDTISDSKNDYPIIVIESPSISTEDFTMTKSKVNGEVKIEVFATSKEVLEKILMKVIDSIETYKSDLANNNIKNVVVLSNNYEMFKHGSIKIHYGWIRFSFKYYYDKTLAW